jgi:peptidoglycan/LPS O-acetylase OafA/YrhL
MPVPALAIARPVPRPEVSAASGTGTRVDYLDGIRGVAAFYVLLCHTQLFALGLLHAPASQDPAHRLAALARILNYFFNFGHVAVDIFIVLSGYCLMLPVVRSADRSLRGGLKAYLRRRGKRILIPYYAALALSLAIGLALTGRLYPAPLTLSHVLLVHNLWPSHLFAINPAMWSIAVEWQIYFVFALILLPVWRRTGNAGVLVASLALGLAPLYLLPLQSNFDWSCSWYITLFTLGMLAATDLTRPWNRALNAGTARKFAALALAVAVVVPFVYLLQTRPSSHALWATLFRQQNRGVGWPLDVLVGLAAASFLVAAARSTPGQRSALRSTVALLESRPVRFLGAVSYSVYLIHVPAIAALAILIKRLGTGPSSSYALAWTLGPIVGLAAGYLLYLGVERHCTSTAAPKPPTPRPIFGTPKPAMLAPLPEGAA